MLPRGSAVLEYGCGGGAYAALEAARNGHRVTAIDLSPVAVEHAQGRAHAAGVAELIDFRVMNAEALELAPTSFDFVCGLGVIHHLDIGASLREVARVMRPEAVALFVEPLGHNPLINLYRNRTPEQRTVDEHPLVMADLPLIATRFQTVQATYFHLLASRFRSASAATSTRCWAPWTSSTPRCYGPPSAGTPGWSAFACRVRVPDTWPARAGS